MGLLTPLLLFGFAFFQVYGKFAYFRYTISVQKSPSSESDLGQHMDGIISFNITEP